MAKFIFQVSGTVGTVGMIQAVILCSGGLAHGQCQRWGSEFSAGPNCTVYALGVYDSGQGPELYAGGCFGEIIDGPINANGIARWDGTTWHQMGQGFNDEVGALEVFDDGTGPQLYIGGWFTALANGGFPAYRINRWDGVNYSALAPGLAGGFGGTNANVKDLQVFDDGSGPALYACGTLPYSNGVTLNHVAKWTGPQWVPLGSGLSTSAYTMTIYDDGSGPALFVGGDFNSAGGLPASGLAKWDGSTWTPIGLGVIPAAFALHVWDSGSGPELYVGTGLAHPSGGGTTFGIVKWDGTTWSDVGGGTNGAVLSFAIHDDGTGEALYAGGYHAQAGSISAKRIARWNGSQWSALGGGIPNEISEVHALAQWNDGSGSKPDLYLGGAFYQAANLWSNKVARWITCEDVVESFCFGDGTFAPCPCRESEQGPPNYGSSGHGCDNSQLTGGALLSASGSPAPDTIVLNATDELPTALTIFLQGNQLLTTATPFGDGLRCAGGSLKRLYKKSAAAGAVSAPVSGEPSVTSRSAALGDPITPGSLRYYQTYYRDPNPNLPVCSSPYGSTFNSSNGIRIVW